MLLVTAQAVLRVALPTVPTKQGAPTRRRADETKKPGAARAWGLGESYLYPNIVGVLLVTAQAILRVALPILVPDLLAARAPTPARANPFRLPLVQRREGSRRVDLEAEPARSGVEARAPRGADAWGGAADEAYLD